MLASLKEKVQFRKCLCKLRGWRLCVLLYKAFRAFDCVPPRARCEGSLPRWQLLPVTNLIPTFSSQ